MCNSIRLRQRCPSEWESKLRELHARGYPDWEIGAKLGITRLATGRFRRSLGLLSNASSARVRERRIAAQPDRGGIARNEVASKYNLPADLTVRQIRTLLALVSGPKSRRQVLADLGVKCDRGAIPVVVDGVTTWRTCYTLFSLTIRGLVYRIDRRENGQMLKPLYSLTADAMNLLTSPQGATHARTDANER